MSNILDVKTQCKLFCWFWPSGIRSKEKWRQVRFFFSFERDHNLSNSKIFISFGELSSSRRFGLFPSIPMHKHRLRKRCGKVNMTKITWMQAAASGGAKQRHTKNFKYLSVFLQLQKVSCSAVPFVVVDVVLCSVGWCYYLGSSLAPCVVRSLYFWYYSAESTVHPLMCWMELVEG